MQSKEVKKWQDEEALKRYQMIAPLLDEDLDEAKRSSSKTHLMTLVNDAGALYKVGNSALINTALINTEVFEMYLEKFREPARPLPKHVWNRVENEISQRMTQ